MKTAQAITDQTLIKAYLNGDEKSFEILLGRNQDRVFGYIISKIKNYDLANDIFQDVFIKVIKNLKKGAYNEEGKFLPWVLTIAHNLVIDHYRLSRTHASLDPRISDTKRESDPMQVVQLSLNNAKLKRALKKLKPNYRNIIVLKFINELDNTEISKILKKSEGSVRILQFRALKSLRQVMQSMGITEA